MNSPTPPRLRVTAETGPDALVAFIFGTAAAVPSAVDCGLLAGPPVEAWCGNGHYAVRVVEETETGGDIEAATARAYARLLVAMACPVRRSSAHGAQPFAWCCDASRALPALVARR